MSETVTITWTCDIFPFDSEQKFKLSEKKSWKGKLIRGYDVAEILADQVWSVTQNTPTIINISAPAAYKGSYTLAVKMEPTFSAKRVDNVV